MIDTLNLCLFLDEVAKDVAFSVSSKCFDEDPTEIYYPSPNGEKHRVLCGKIGNLKVTISNASVKIKDNSFCKWLLGDNIKTLQRKDIQHGIERLSDILHLPIKESYVQRLDLGANLIMKNEVSSYFNKLGCLLWFQRLEQEHGLYYSSGGGNIKLAFYDKLRERKEANEEIPLYLTNANILRYELRLLHRLPTILKVEEVKAKNLYEEQFYIRLWQLWRKYYYEIEKINEVDINYNFMIGVKKQNQLALIEFVLNHGGINNYLNSLKEAQKNGKLTRKEAHDMKKAVNEAFANNANNAEIIKQSELIKELNAKIDEVTLNYR